MGQIKVEKNAGGIEGLCVIEPTVHGDARGYFMETYNQKDMEEAGLTMTFVQDNQSSSTKGVLRGLHFQKQFPQGKLVRVVKGSLFAGLFGNQQIVSVAMGQLGNSGGQKFWSWYGFDSRVEWCACFVSWCADQSGLIASGNVPKFSLCSDGVSWFQGKNKWQSGGTTPTAGMIIFFDWDHDAILTTEKQS